MKYLQDGGEADNQMNVLQSQRNDMKPEKFRTMTSRGLTVSDLRETEVVAAPVFIGNKPLWPISLHEKRFDNINKDPEILTRTKKIGQPKWELFDDRTIDFRNKIYAHNVYLPSQKLVSRRQGVDIKDMKKLVGRDDQPTKQNFYVAQAGSATHIDLMNLKTASKKTLLFGSYKTCGIVSMN